MPLTDPLAHHFLGYVHFCAMCTLYAKVRAYKHLQNSRKKLQNDYKNQNQTHTKTIKRLQIPKNWVTLLFQCFRQYAKNMENLGLLLLFCRVLTESCFWKTHGHDCKFEHILWETIWNQAFSMSEIYNQFRGSGGNRKFKVAVEGIKFTIGFWRYRPKRLLLELESSKSRTPGVDQKFLIFWKPI